VQAFPQAPVEQELYIEVPKGCNVGTDANEYVLQVLNNIYGPTRSTPSLSSKILHAHTKSPPYNGEWSYRSVIGKMNFLEKSTRPDLAYVVLQCARLMSAPTEEHANAVKHIGRYLLSTTDQGIIMHPNADGVTCYSDADFAGIWHQTSASDDSNTARSLSGTLVKYANCPLTWGSRLQTEIALSSTEIEYIALSQSLREILPIIRLINELHKNGFKYDNQTPVLYCTVFEDNNGAMEMASTPKMRSQTKHINIKYHHFREAVHQGIIRIKRIDTTQQQADIFTKPLMERIFIYLRRLIMGW
jgi:hypothetical protein